MGRETGIQWCDASFNPWHGCEKVSPACAHCYAETQTKRWSGAGYWGPGHAFKFFGDKHWAEPLNWARTLPAKLGRRPRVFCASMADVFEERPELGAARERLFATIAATPELDWLILTKRPEYARAVLGHPMFWLGVNGQLLEMCREVIPGGMSDLAAGRQWLPNVWMGVSIENARFTWRADVLRQIPAAVRFISAEPLLGSLFQSSEGRGAHPRTDSSSDAATTPEATPPSPESGVAPDGSGDHGDDRAAAKISEHRTPNGTQGTHRAPLDLTGIDWIIVGGESGPKARPFHLEHAREIIRSGRAIYPLDFDGETWQHATPPAVFVKQLGAKPVDYIAGVAGSICDLKLRDRKGGDWDEWPSDLRIREFPSSARARVPA